jgi:molybdate transport system substrate-binding protein
MINKFVYVLCIVVSLFMFSGCNSEKKTSSVTVFAAASTIDLMSELALLFEKETGTQVKINPASSGILARQIKDGASCDVFISASKKWIDFLDSNSLLDERSDFMKNRLVLITHIDSTMTSFELDKNSNLPQLFSGRISIGDPAHVPAGVYAVEALKSLSWYEALEERILPAADVRAAMSVVEFDETELGIVYATDAERSDKVKVISFFPEDSHSPVLYFCASIKNSNPPGRIFYDFLLTNSGAEELYEKYGFLFTK